MPRKAHVAVFSDGTLLECSERDIWRESSDFQKKITPYLFIRVGTYSVTIGQNGLAIHTPDSYREPLEEIARDSEYYESAKRDRISQLALIESALKKFGHPLEGLVRAEVAAERATYGKEQ